MATARDAGVSWGQTSDKYFAYGDLGQLDYMDYRDNVDYFKYQLEAPGTISVRVTGGDTLVGTAQLLDSSGNVIASRSGAFSGGFNIFPTSEPAGTYYLKMTQSSGAAPYSVRFVSDYAGDTTATARDLGDLTNSTREDYDMVGTFDTDLASYDDSADLYKFTLDQTSPLYAYLTDAQGLIPPTFDANLRIARDSNNDGFIESNEVLYQSNNDAASTTGGNDQISTTLTAGTYYVEVVPDGAYTTYQLDLNSDLDNTGSITNLTKAVNLGSLIGETNTDGGLSGYGNDTTDYYKFTMAASGTFSATADVNAYYSRSTAALSLQLLQDKNGNGLFDTGEAIGTAGTGSVTATLAAGTYYLRLSNAAQEQAYSLRVLSDYAGDVNAPRSMAPISGTNPPTQTFQDYVEENFGTTSDVNDAYKFVLPSTYTVTLKTTGVAGEDLALQLVDDFNNNGVIDSGDVIAASDVLNSPNETIVKTLAAGTYYVRVHGVNGGTNYTLTAAFAGTSTPTPTPTATKLTGTTIGTAGSYGGSGNTIAKATDGNLSTFFDGPTPNGDYVGLDLGSAKTITAVAYASRSGWASRMNGGIFQASNSATFASGNVTLYTVPTGANPGSAALTTQSVSVAGTYRYVRYLGPNGSYGDVAEVAFYGTGGTALTKFTGTVIGTGGSYNNAGNTIAKAFDGSTTTYFDGPTPNGDWAGLDLGSAKVVKQVIYTPRPTYGSRMVGGQIQVSNTADFSSGVVTLATITAAPTGTTTLALSNAVAYRYVRYLAPSGSYGDVAELEFDG
jgi:hypothetical protein